MLIANKKFVLGLVILTLLGGLVFLQKHKPQNIMSQKELSAFSADFNQSLPVKISDEISLVKTQPANISSSIFSLDFFYSYYKNKNDIKNLELLTQSMIYQTCQNETTLSLLKREIVIRHQFVTLDKEKLPYIGVSLEECVNIVKSDKNLPITNSATGK